MSVAPSNVKGPATAATVNGAKEERLERRLRIVSNSEGGERQAPSSPSPSAEATPSPKNAKAETTARLTGYVNKTPPARARYSEAEENACAQRLAAATERRQVAEWIRSEGAKRHAARTQRKPITATWFVPLLEAAKLCREQRGEDGFTAFWDALALSILDGDFDGTERLHVVDDQPVIRMRMRSEHMRLLTADRYSYDDVVQRRLARCWTSRRTVMEWCEGQGFPVPDRWRLPSDISHQPEASDTSHHKASPAIEALNGYRVGKRAGAETTWMATALRDLYPTGDPVKQGHQRDDILEKVRAHAGQSSGSLTSLDRARAIAWPSGDI